MVTEFCRDKLKKGVGIIKRAHRIDRYVYGTKTAVILCFAF